MPENIFTIDEGKNKRVLVGQVVKTKIGGKSYLTKKVNRSAHYFRKVEGYGIQTEVLERLKDRIMGVLIFEEDTGNMFWSYINTWFSVDSSGKNFGHGKQTLLPEKYMELIYKKQ